MATARRMYTEDQVRDAIRLAGHGYAEDRIMASLKGDHIHDFTDDDTITVKEFRKAWNTRFAAGTQVMLTQPVVSREHLLRDISEAREPAYPPRSVWKDANDVEWRRAGTGGGWHKFGNSGYWGDEVPVRPLRRMDIV
jgi:hypothetical protein